jgi:hypothetical protein
MAERPGYSRPAAIAGVRAIREVDREARMVAERMRMNPDEDWS